jgi:hypothetical protein
MAAQVARSCGSTLPLSALDQASLAFLMSMRDNPEIQRDGDLFKMFNNAISFLTASTSSLAISQADEIVSANAATSPRMFSLVPSIQIDTSGEEGASGYPGTATTASSGRGLDGMDGTDGADGESAHDINLQLKAGNETVDVQWGSGCASMRLGEVRASIFLRAVGGNGGRGGNGGQGGPGATGMRGKDATRYSSGKDGGQGHSGGVGGNGGAGGNGGRGGQVTVRVDPRDSDLLMLLNIPETTGGDKAVGGSKGRGGIGGSGGPGGSGHSWTELRTGTRMVSNGRGGMYPAAYGYSVSMSNPGGSTGPMGTIGDDGGEGAVGRAGTDGSFQMIIGETTYHTLYNLAITVSKIVDLARGNPANIYEPGEHVSLMVSVFNTGGMPTPSQDIEVSLRPIAWGEHENSSLILTASEHLPIGGAHNFSIPFSFRINEQYPPMEEPLSLQETLTYQALLCRVNKSFSSVSQQKDRFLIRYPVQISPLIGKVSIAFGEKSIQSLFLQNITSASMGRLGPQKRRVFVTFEILESEDVKSSDIELLKTGESDFQESNKVTAEVDDLSPNSEKNLAVSFRFTNPDLRAQSTVRMITSLYLEYFNSENRESLGRTRCIQRRVTQMQFL